MSKGRGAKKTLRTGGDQEKLCGRKNPEVHGRCKAFDRRVTGLTRHTEGTSRGLSVGKGGPEGEPRKGGHLKV